MKLNINAKELLALYNLLTQVTEQTKDTQEGDAVQLRQIHGRLKAIIIAGLSGKATDPVDSWLKHEQDKIDKLSDQNQHLKEVARDPSNFAPVKPADILTDNEDEVPDDLAYPSKRKGPPPPNMPRPGKHRGRR